MSPPAVSIVMPVCNSGRFLPDTVGSVLAQGFLIDAWETLSGSLWEVGT